ncbi:hypothetical protein AAFF_G00338510 [Aldrovandia affinis]|uniref:B30.2/SPRY domain-containing protein n=1 Tax=Aldrovandia affinis TaxID=143900 RepID=A0AAD7R626_9TELE|nr:hypothetical protein AAFF_G00338510 [Aldrovandia affinis]
MCIERCRLPLRKFCPFSTAARHGNRGNEQHCYSFKPSDPTATAEPPALSTIYSSHFHFILSLTLDEPSLHLPAFYWLKYLPISPGNLIESSFLGAHLSCDLSTVEKVHILEPRTREDFLQYSCQLTLNPNTVHRVLRLSEGNREVTRVEQDQSYPDHPERFDGCAQVLCREGLSGHSYWEAEWSGGEWRVEIAVSDKEISRKGGGDDCILGYNDKSWSLFRSPSRCSFYHNKERTDLPAPSPSSRIGVYLDHGAGTLSFYSVSDTMTLLHRVQSTFTQPLYPGFGVYNGSVKLCDLG